MFQKSVSDVDKLIGVRIRQRRIAIGMSQEKLGTALGLTFQQIQKYEKGANRIGAGRLLKIAALLGIPVSFFFEQADPGIQASTSPGSHDFLVSAEGVELTQAFLQIDSPAMRRAIINLAKAAARDLEAIPSAAE